jgi:hypothetical protein
MCWKAMRVLVASCPSSKIEQLDRLAAVFEEPVAIKMLATQNSETSSAVLAQVLRS